MTKAEIASEIYSRMSQERTSEKPVSRSLQECDTVFFFDIPLDDCLSGVRSRLGKPREDMPWIDIELDKEFHQWILNFPAEQRPEIVRLLDTFDGEVFHFKSREEADNYIDSLIVSK